MLVTPLPILQVVIAEQLTKVLLPILVQSSPISALTQVAMYGLVIPAVSSPLPSSSTISPFCKVNLQKPEYGGGGGIVMYGTLSQNITHVWLWVVRGNIRCIVSGSCKFFNVLHKLLFFKDFNISYFIYKYLVIFIFFIYLCKKPYKYENLRILRYARSVGFYSGAV